MSEKEIISLVQKTLRELLGEALKPLFEKQKSLENSMNLLYEHLDTIEKIATRLGMAQDEIQFMRERMDRNMKDLKADVKDVQAKVEEKMSEQTADVKQVVEEVKNVIIENTQ